MFIPSIYGNSLVKERLEKQFKNNKIPHSIILTGDDGTGKKTLSLNIAAALLCQNHSQNQPCCSCPMCNKVFNKQALDVRLIIEPSSTIKIDKIREIKDDIYLSPVESEYKIYIIDHAEKMTTQSQNALLKFYEEPPSNVFIILLTSNISLLLPTIISRAQIIKTETFSDEELSKYLLTYSQQKEKFISIKNTNPNNFDQIINNANGSIGKAIANIDHFNDTNNNISIIMSLLDNLSNHNLKIDFYNLYAQIPQSRADFKEFLLNLHHAIADLMIIKSINKPSSLNFFQQYDDAKSIAIRISSTKLSKIEKTITKTLEYTDQNININTISTILLQEFK